MYAVSVFAWFFLPRRLIFQVAWHPVTCHRVIASRCSINVINVAGATLRKGGWVCGVWCVVEWMFHAHFHCRYLCSSLVG